MAYVSDGVLAGLLASMLIEIRGDKGDGCHTSMSSRHNMILKVLVSLWMMLGERIVGRGSCKIECFRAMDGTISISKRLHGVWVTFQTRLCKLAVYEFRGTENESDVKIDEYKNKSDVKIDITCDNGSDVKVKVKLTVGTP